MRQFLEMLRPMMPFTALFVMTTVWVLLSRNDIVVLETRMFFVLIGTVFSNISVRKQQQYYNGDSISNFLCFIFQCRLIVAQMSETRCEAWNLFFWPIIVAILVSIFPYSEFGYSLLPKLYESWILYVLTGAVTLAHIHYGVGLVSQMLF